MNRSENLRPATRSAPFPGYTSQPPSHPRSTPLGSSRLQNSSTKLGNGASWGFGAQSNGVQGLSNQQSRPTGATSFAQTIGGNQPSTSLDMSEFPSLSGNSQPQFQNQSQAIWQRNTQQTPVQRPQQQQSQQPNNAPISQHSMAQRRETSASESEDMFTGSSHLPSSHLQNAIDGYPQSSQDASQIPNSRRRQSSNIEDFPPLGRNGLNDVEIDQNPFGAFSSSNPFTSQSNTTQPRHSISGSQNNDTRSPLLGDRHMTPGAFATTTISRSPLENGRTTQSSTQDFGRERFTGPQQNNDNTMTSLVSNIQSHISRQQRDNEAGDSMITASSDDTALKQQGIDDLIARITSDDPVVRGLTRGIELGSLGLNLNAAEPLYETWSGPFAEPGARPLQPDYVLPECYTVDNVHPVRQKIPGFSDETLFWIFYTQPRDIMQELAAQELLSRNWRYHMKAGMWLTKDPTLPDPLRPDLKGEQGHYIFWNHRAWEKMKQEFYLLYDDLAPSTGRTNGQ